MAHDHMSLRKLLDGEGWPPLDADRLAFSLLENFASTDPILRDTLSLTILDRLVEEKRLTRATRVDLLTTALDDDHLFANIGHRASDSVFLRSFCVLIVPMMLEPDLAVAELPKEAVARALDRVLAYARAERDWRGYVERKGWAHAVAHTADALSALGRHPHTALGRISEILSTIHHLAMLPYPLGYLEDDRLALAAFQLIHSGRPSQETVQAWLDSFVLMPEFQHPANTLRVANGEHFLRSLFFRCRATDGQGRWLDTIQTAVDRLDIFLLDPTPE
jgi:hypothetical protein